MWRFMVARLFINLQVQRFTHQLHMKLKNFVSWIKPVSISIYLFKNSVKQIDKKILFSYAGRIDFVWSNERWICYHRNSLHQRNAKSNNFLNLTVWINVWFIFSEITFGSDHKWLLMQSHHFYSSQTCFHLLCKES